MPEAEPPWSPSALFASPYLPPPTPPPLRERMEQLRLGGQPFSQPPSQLGSRELPLGSAAHVTTRPAHPATTQAGAENAHTNGVSARQECCTGSASGAGGASLLLPP